MSRPREDSALSEAVVQRLESLDSLWESIFKAGDRFEQLVNIEAVMDAYRSGELQWNGLVTYWSFGSQLCQPRPFNWDEFEAINERYEGSMSFWTEGVSVTFVNPDFGENILISRLSWTDRGMSTGNIVCQLILLPSTGFYTWYVRFFRSAY